MRNARAAGATVLVAVALAASAAAAASSAPSAEVSPRAVSRDRAGDPPRVDEGVAAIEHWHRVESVGRFYAELERQAAENTREEQRRAALERQRAAGRADRSHSGPGGVWGALRACENGGSYRSDPGDRYRGAYQFDRGTWAGLGYSGDPAAADPAVQDEAARRLQERSGWSQWPRCARKLGLL